MRGRIAELVQGDLQSMWVQQTHFHLPLLALNCHHFGMVLVEQQLLDDGLCCKVL